MAALLYLCSIFFFKVKALRLPLRKVGVILFHKTTVMSKKIKFKVGDYVFSKKQRLTSRVTAVREYGCYIQRDKGNLCCPWDDVIEATREQKQEYFRNLSKRRAATCNSDQAQLNTQIKPFYGGKPEKKKHPVNPSGKDILKLKAILEFLNLKYPLNEKAKSADRFPISAVWHSSGQSTEMVKHPDQQGLKSVVKKYGYGWTLVYDWMWLAEDVKFQAYLKAMRAKFRDLKFDCVFFTHPKVSYSGLLSIKPVKR